MHSVQNSAKTGNGNGVVQLGARGLNDLASAVEHGAMHLLNETRDAFTSAEAGWSHAPFSAPTLEESALAAGLTLLIGAGALPALA